MDFQGFHVIFKGPGLGFSRISRHFQGLRLWIFKDFTSLSRAPALDFQGFHVIFKGPGLGFSRISRYFQRPRPWIFKDFTSFSRAPASDFQGFHVIFKGPGLGFPINFPFKECPFGPLFVILKKKSDLHYHFFRRNAKMWPKWAFYKRKIEWKRGLSKTRFQKLVFSSYKNPVSGYSLKSGRGFL